MARIALVWEGLLHNNVPDPYRWIVDGADHAGLGQGRVVLDEQQVDHQPDDFARREVLAGGLVGQFGELADQFLEDRAHLGVADGLGVQVDVGELLGDQIEQPGLGQAVDLGVEVEGLEDVAHGGRERLHVGEQVLPDVVLIAHQLLHVERRRVVEKLAGLPQQKRLGIQSRLLSGRQLGQHGGLCGFQHAIQPKYGERRSRPTVALCAGFMLSWIWRSSRCFTASARVTTCSMSIGMPESVHCAPSRT